MLKRTFEQLSLKVHHKCMCCPPSYKSTIKQIFVHKFKFCVSVNCHIIKPHGKNIIIRIFTIFCVLRYFNFIRSGMSTYVKNYNIILITLIKWKKNSFRTLCKNTDYIILNKFDYRSIYGNIKANNSVFELLNENWLCCTFVRQE